MLWHRRTPTLLAFGPPPHNASVVYPKGTCLKNRAQEIPFADLDAALPQDRIGGGDVKEEFGSARQADIADL